MTMAIIPCEQCSFIQNVIVLVGLIQNRASDMKKHKFLYLLVRQTVSKSKKTKQEDDLPLVFQLHQEFS